jgi:hypothetical protein
VRFHIVGIFQSCPLKELLTDFGFLSKKFNSCLLHCRLGGLSTHLLASDDERAATTPNLASKSPAVSTRIAEPVSGFSLLPAST